MNTFQHLTELESPLIKNSSHAHQLTNEELSDEIEAINAIYGEATLKITGSQHSNITCLLSIDGYAISLEMRFPLAYPARPPIVTGIDPLWMGQWPAAKDLRASFEQVLKEVFIPGSVCIFDVVEGIRSTPTHTAPQARSTTATRASSKESSSTRTLVNLSQLQSAQECSACLDLLMSVDLVTLKCRHAYCTECLHRKSQSLCRCRRPCDCQSPNA